jgi:hypothetical protein
MKKKAGLILTVILGIMLIAGSALAEEEKPWFDLENCAFCKNLSAEEGLLDNFPKWEHYNIHNGMLTLSVVEKEYIPAFKNAIANMNKVVKQLEAGENVHLCGMCESFGSLMMAGVKIEEIESENIFVSMMTSDNPEVVEQIHQHTDRTNDEYAKWLEAEKAAKE